MRRAAKRLVAGTATVQSFIHISQEEAAYEIRDTLQPAITATIFSQDQLATFLAAFADRLIARQTEWLMEGEDDEG